MTDGECDRFMKEKKRRRNSAQNESPDSLEKRIITAMQDWQENETGERPGYLSLRENFCFKYHTVLDGYDAGETDYFHFVHPIQKILLLL